MYLHWAALIWFFFDDIFLYIYYEVFLLRFVLGIPI